jgi:hypothetical protein
VLLLSLGEAYALIIELLSIYGNYAYLSFKFSTFLIGSILENLLYLI